MKRVRRTEAEWRQLIAEMRTSGLSSANFARERGLCASSVYLWHHRLGADEHANAGQDANLFAEVRVASPASKSCRVEVITRSGRIVRVRGALDARLLRDVIKVVESC